MVHPSWITSILGGAFFWALSMLSFVFAFWLMFVDVYFRRNGGVLIYSRFIRCCIKSIFCIHNEFISSTSASTARGDVPLETFAPGALRAPHGRSDGRKKKAASHTYCSLEKKGPDPNVIPNGNYMDWMQVLVGVHWLVINQSPCCGAKHISKSKCTKHTMLGTLWKLRCRKSARRCGAKHISKSKCTKHLSFGALL